MKNIQQKLKDYISGLGFDTSILTDLEFLVTTFTHKSYAADFKVSPKHNERLELLGDSILGAAITTLLFKNFPDYEENTLTLMKISLVREEHLAFVGRKIEINDCILLGHGERKSGGDDKDVIIADTVESLIGFIYLQYGFDKALDFIEKNIYNTKENLGQINEKSSKTMVQEQTQKLYKSLPIYVDSEDTIDERGNCTLYKSELIINGNLISVGFGQNKKRAQEDAADKAIENGFLNS